MFKSQKALLYAQRFQLLIWLYWSFHKSNYANHDFFVKDRLMETEENNCWWSKIRENLAVWRRFLLSKLE